MKARPSEDLVRLATSAVPADRLRSLGLMQERIGNGDDPSVYLDLARTLIGDSDNDCRWQAAIVVGESIETEPEKVWEVVCEYGTSTDEDMRVAVATVLLEHLLEHHFDTYFPKLRQRIEDGAPLLADTLSRCWLFGDAIPHEREIEALAARLRE